LGFLLQYRLEAIKAFPQATTLRIELALSSRFWYYPQFQGLIWYPNSYTLSPTHTPSHVIINETREEYISRIEGWVRSDCHFEGKSFESILAGDARLARVLEMVIKKETVLNAGGLISLLLGSGMKGLSWKRLRGLIGLRRVFDPGVEIIWDWKGWEFWIGRILRIWLVGLRSDVGFGDKTGPW
jgi:hypothetical protein